MTSEKLVLIHVDKEELGKKEFCKPDFDWLKVFVRSTSQWANALTRSYIMLRSFIAHVQGILPILEFK